MPFILFVIMPKNTVTNAQKYVQECLVLQTLQEFFDVKFWSHWETQLIIQHWWSGYIEHWVVWARAHSQVIRHNVHHVQLPAKQRMVFDDHSGGCKLLPLIQTSCCKTPFSSAEKSSTVFAVVNVIYGHCHSEKEWENLSSKKTVKFSLNLDFTVIFIWKWPVSDILSHFFANTDFSI